MFDATKKTFVFKSFKGESKIVKIGFGNGKYIDAYYSLGIVVDNEIFMEDLINFLKTKNVKFVQNKIKKEDELFNLE
jgi:hypothetical protein